MTRTRECNNPAPEFGGEACAGGIDTETLECNTDACPGEVLVVSNMEYV